MNTLSHYILTGLVLLAITACQKELTYSEALNKNEDNLTDPKAVEEAYFLVKTKSANMLGTLLTSMAVDSGYAAVIKDLARQNLADHKKLGDDLPRIAHDGDIALPTQMSSSHQSIYVKVAASNHKDFDRNFIEAIKKLNEAMNEEFNSMATDAQDEEIRAFAARRLGIIRSHTNRIAQVEDELLVTN